jgi:hypothetical protein
MRGINNDDRDIAFASYRELEKAYAEGRLHPMDLKSGIAEAVATMLEPVRNYFETNKEAKECADASEKPKDEPSPDDELAYLEGVDDIEQDVRLEGKWQRLLQEVRKRGEARGLPVLTGSQLHENILEVFDTTFAITRSMRAIAIVVALSCFPACLVNTRCQI